MKVKKAKVSNYDKVENQPLCYRCEWRAQYHEKGHAPRCECGMVETASVSCYMYRPVRSVVQELNKGEKMSPFMCSMFAGRSHGVGVAKCEYVAKQITKKSWAVEARVNVKEVK